MDPAETVMAHHRAPKWAKRRGAPRWAHLLSWIVAAVIWLWIVYVTIVSDWPVPSQVLQASAAQLGALALNAVPFVVLATVVAALALFLVRLIWYGAAWLKLRF